MAVFDPCLRFAWDVFVAGLLQQARLGLKHTQSSNWRILLLQKECHRQVDLEACCMSITRAPVQCGTALSDSSAQAQLRGGHGWTQWLIQLLHGCLLAYGCTRGGRS